MEQTLGLKANELSLWSASELSLYRGTWAGTCSIKYDPVFFLFLILTPVNSWRTAIRLPQSNGAAAAANAGSAAIILLWNACS